MCMYLPVFSDVVGLMGLPSDPESAVDDQRLYIHGIVNVINQYSVSFIGTVPMYDVGSMYSTTIPSQSMIASSAPYAANSGSLMMVHYIHNRWRDDQTIGIWSCGETGTIMRLKPV